MEALIVLAPAIGFVGGAVITYRFGQRWGVAFVVVFTGAVVIFA